MCKTTEYEDTAPSVMVAQAVIPLLIAKLKVCTGVLYHVKTFNKSRKVDEEIISCAEALTQIADTYQYHLRQLDEMTDATPPLEKEKIAAKAVIESRKSDKTVTLIGDWAARKLRNIIIKKSIIRFLTFGLVK